MRDETPTVILHTFSFFVHFPLTFAAFLTFRFNSFHIRKVCGGCGGRVAVFLTYFSSHLIFLLRLDIFCALCLVIIIFIFSLWTLFDIYFYLIYFVSQLTRDISSMMSTRSQEFVFFFFFIAIGKWKIKCGFSVQSNVTYICHLLHDENGSRHRIYKNKISDLMKFAGFAVCGSATRNKFVALLVILINCTFARFK